MYIPAARERVVVVGRPGVFIVLAVDREEQFATVIPVTGAAFYAEDVRFTRLRPQRPDLPNENTGATASAA